MKKILIYRRLYVFYFKNKQNVENSFEFPMQDYYNI